MLFILENKRIYAFKLNTTFLIDDFFIYDKSRNNYENNIICVTIFYTQVISKICFFES